MKVRRAVEGIRWYLREVSGEGDYDRYANALDDGRVLAPAKSLDDMQKVVTNSTVDGILAAFFAILIVIVIADAVRIWYRVLAARRPVELREAPFVESRIVAGSGLLPTAEERQQRQLVGAGVGGGPSGVGGDGMPADDAPDGDAPADGRRRPGGGSGP